VRRPTLSSPVKPALRVSGRAYAGYPFFVALTVTGAPDNTSVVVERRAGGGWMRAGERDRPPRQGGGRGHLAHGDHQLRAAVTIGSQSIVGDAVRVSVRRAARWQTRASDAGACRGRAGFRSVRFEVLRAGRELRGFRAFVPMPCPGVVGGQLTTQIGTAALSRAKIAPDGSFVAASTPRSGTAIRLRGRLRKGKVAGRVELAVGDCSGGSAYTAARG